MKEPMDTKLNGYDLLINKLDQFIRKYYVNKLIKGGLYTLGLVLGMFLLFSLMENYFYFGKGVRKLLFGSFLLTSVMALGYWVIYPLVNYLGLGNVISHEKAADIVGDHFIDVKDKLLNVLQLKKSTEGQADNQLLLASIEQKTDAIKVVPFKSAIDLSGNRQYLKYAIPPMLALIVILFAAPSLITDSTSRIINNNTEYEKAAPFTFLLEDEKPKVLQYEDHKIVVKVEGDVLPNDAYIEVDNFQYKLKKIDAATFSYTLRNIQENKSFRIFSGRVSSKVKEIEVLAKPNISGFDIRLDYPAYTGRKDETISNMGNIAAPEGTIIYWTFETQNTEKVALKFGESLEVAEQKSSSSYGYKKSVKNDELYKVMISNSNISDPDSIGYSINVLKDEYPTIAVEEFQDSLETYVKYFIGNAADDYGLRSVSFNYTITKESGGRSPQQSVILKSPQARETQFSHTFDLTELKLEPGDQVSYYFETKDNDEINGSKSAKTSVMSFEKPSLEEFKQLEEDNSEQIKDDLKKSIDNLKKIQEKYEKMKEDMLQKKELDWQDKEEIQKLLDEQKKIQEKLEQAKEKFEENLKNQEEFNKQDEKIEEKQEKMKELFEEALDPERQELMEKIQELLQELEKDNSIEMMEQMEQENDSMEKDMDRLLELYKQLEVEKEVNDLMKELEKLAEEQEKLAEETEKGEKPQEELKAEQEKLNEKMEDLKKEMEELEKKNEELDKPKDLGAENEEKMEDIQEEMEDSQEQLEQDENQKASDAQKAAAEKMKEMASSLQESMEGGDQDQKKEDAKLLRQLLENLVDISYDQESISNDIKGTSTVTPRYVELVQEQFKIKDDFKLVEDSLVSLANRNDQIQGFILDKVSEVKINMKSGVKYMEDRKTKDASNNQLRSMTNLNDLALMLSEALEQMQQQMAQSMPGSQMCDKPGSKPGSKPGDKPSDKISEGSKGLGKKLKEMMEKEGKEKGKGKGSGEGGNSAKDFAEAAARQAAMRKALEDMQRDAKEQGEGSQELEKLIEEMNEIEIDLVNKRLDGELLKRQQDITTRLLQAEKAERKREYDDKRKGETATEIKRELPPSLKKYLKQREAEIEMYKTVAPELRPYYKTLVDEYYKALKSSN